MRRWISRALLVLVAVIAAEATAQGAPTGEGPTVAERVEDAPAPPEPGPPAPLEVGAWRITEPTRAGERVSCAATIAGRRWDAFGASWRRTARGLVLEGEARLVGPDFTVMAPRLALDVEAHRALAAGEGSDRPLLVRAGWSLAAARVTVALREARVELERI